MKVALDATPLSVSTGGVTRYTSELGRALAGEFPEDEYWLLSDQPFPLNSGRPANLRRGRAPRNFLERRWSSCGLIAETLRHRIDVFHGTDFAVPYIPVCPSVLTLHDLSPWKKQFKEGVSSRVSRRTPFLLGLGLATMVVTPSEGIRREAIDWFRIHPGRIVSIPLAAASLFHPVTDAASGEPYFLYAGSLEKRKNISMLLDVWREVRSRHVVGLVLAGKRRESFPEISPEPGLRVLGEVPDEDLPGLYSGAVAFLYPSLYEGFGLPVLEAMSCGAAVICSTSAAATELAGDAAVRIEAGNAPEWVSAMTAALTRTDWLAGRRRLALERSRQFSWQRTARLTRQVYEEARRCFGQ